MKISYQVIDFQHGGIKRNGVFEYLRIRQRARSLIKPFFKKEAKLKSSRHYINYEEGESDTLKRTFLVWGSLPFDPFSEDFKLDLAGSSKRKARWMTVGERCKSSIESSPLSYCGKKFEHYDLKSQKRN